MKKVKVYDDYIDNLDFFYYEEILNILIITKNTITHNTDLYSRIVDLLEDLPRTKNRLR